MQIAAASKCFLDVGAGEIAGLRLVSNDLAITGAEDDLIAFAFRGDGRFGGEGCCAYRPKRHGCEGEQMRYAKNGEHKEVCNRVLAVMSRAFRGKAIRREPGKDLVRVSFGRLIEGPMFRWLRRLSRLPYQIDLYPARKRMPAVTVRAYQESDFDVCSEIYRLNEPGRFPSGVLEEFQRSVRDGDRLRYVVIEDEGRVCAFGGVGIEREKLGHSARLCFGMVHPNWHRKGLGTVLLLSRLALLPRELSFTAALWPVEGSRSFYKRFGFHEVAVAGTECHVGNPLYVCEFLPADRDECRRLLKKANVQLSFEGTVVPIIVRPDAA